MSFFDPAEGWSKDQIAQTQVERLRWTITQASRAPFYRERFAEAGVTPESITCPEDIKKIPFTTKENLREQYPDNMNTVPRSQIVRMHSSSGTTGTPTVIHFTQGDLDRWTNLVARCLHIIGLRPGHAFQNMAGYGLFTAGFGLHYAAERLGCMTIPSGTGNTNLQIKIMQDFKTDAAAILPGYALHLGATLEKMGISPDDLALSIVMTGAEPHSGESRQRIEELLGVKVYNAYGLSEMSGPGVGFECLQQSGLHLADDAFLTEIIDPITHEPVPDGEIGELVMTTLTREAMPILRYHTRDLTRFITGECACGRKHRRIDRILGRVDDMLIIKGTNIYPMQVEEVLMTFPEVGENYLIELEKENYMDQMRVKVEIKDEYYTEERRVLQALQQIITEQLRDELLITPRIELVQRNSIPVPEGKIQRVIDNR